MKKYDQFHKNLTIPILRATVPYYIAISLCVAGSVAAAFFTEDLSWSPLALFIAGYITIAYLYKRKFLRQIVVFEDRVQLYARGGTLKQEYLFADMKVSRQNVVWNERFGTEFEALILYRNMELYDGMLLRKYLRNENILIITNREAIRGLEKQLGLCSGKSADGDSTSSIDKSPLAVSHTPIASAEPDVQYSLLSKDISEHKAIRKNYVIFLALYGLGILLMSLLMDIIILLMLIPWAILVVGSVLLHYSPKMYQRYAVVTKEKVSVYSRKGRHLQDLYFSEIRAVKRSFYMEGVYFAQEADCIILFGGPTLPGKESFEKYWKNKDILFTNNPQLISVLEELVPDEQFLEHKHEMS